MIAVDLDASPPAAHEQRHLHARSPYGYPPSAYHRLLAGASHYALHRLLRTYEQIAGAAILASALGGYRAILGVLMARQTCPEPAEPAGNNALFAHLEASLLARSTRPANAIAALAHTFLAACTTVQAAPYPPRLTFAPPQPAPLDCEDRPAASRRTTARVSSGPY